MTISLNKQQEYIVTHRGYKFLSVQAGPGSGKTRVIVEKVKYMVSHGADPESFLIITFSAKAADELKDRLIEGEIPASDVQKMQISTIHSFCFDILEKTGTAGLDIISEGEKQYLFIKKHKKDLGFVNEAYLRNHEIQSVIGKYDEYSTFKVDTEKLVTYLEDSFEVSGEYVEYVEEFMADNDGEFPVDEIKEIDKENNNTVFKDSYKNAKHIQIARSYPVYLELLEEENAIDFNQMQIRALEIMNNGYLPDYTNILIDEFQDTDPVQMEIFKHFINCDKTKSFTVVGDINQSIYGFRGSDKNYFNELPRDKFEEVYLTTNYRSTEEIIDFTQDYIKDHHSEMMHAECGSTKNNDIYYMTSDDKKAEAQNIVNLIEFLKYKGLKLSDIGILFRSVKSSSSCFNTLTELLDEKNITYHVKGRGDLKDIDEIKYVLTLMYHLIQDDDEYYTFVSRYSADWLNLKTLTSDNALFKLSDDTCEILNSIWDEYEREVIETDKIVCSENKGWGRGVKKYSGMFTKANKRKNEVFSRVKKPVLSDENLKEYGVTDLGDLAFFHSLNELKCEVNSKMYYDRPTITDVYFNILCDITGYLTADLIGENPESANNLSALIVLLKTYEEVMHDRGLRGAFWFILSSIKNIDAYQKDEDALQIMTVHKSKGLEFPAVILASLRQNGFPLPYRKHDEKSVEYIPERFMGYAKSDSEKAHTMEEERVIYVAKTRSEDELILSSISENESKAPGRISDLIDKHTDYCHRINPENININVLKPKDKSDIDKNIRLSFTALQNYNECPFRYRLENELGFTFTAKKEIDDGIFIHSALEIVNKKILANNNSYIGDEEVSKSVETLFEKANIKFKEEDPDNYSLKLETITRDVLKYYYEVGCDLEIIESEYPFYIKGENYSFSGVCDLIYKKDNKLGILDYKNTSLVSEEYLEKYRKQLHYYVMALRDENRKFNGDKIEEIEIYALKYQKPDKIFRFEIDEAYIDELKCELENTAIKIQNNEFETLSSDCEGCEYRKICGK